MPIATIESLDHEGRGVAHVDGKTIFVECALPGEVVEYTSYRKKPNYEIANLNQVLTSSSQRVTPPCAYFGVCGGCAMQHLNVSAQTAARQRLLEDALWHVGRIRPQIVYPAISGVAGGYRFRARLGVRLVQKKGGVLVGFRERHSSFLALMDHCQNLPAAVSALIPALKRLIGSLSSPARFPQVEVAVGEGREEPHSGLQIVLVLRHLDALTPGDHTKLAQFADQYDIVWFLQPRGPDSAWQFHPRDTPALHYTLPEYDIDLGFKPTDFTQVNHGINRMLVRRAMGLLQPRPGERIADLFCGLGNFSLPIARLGADVLGVEGSAELVSRARNNAERNGLAARARFHVSNLFDTDPLGYAALFAGGRPFDKLLIDPPRDGAIELVKSLPDTAAPQRIVYVSCNPATLARDAGVLVHEKKYVLRGAGIASMFTHTAHVESIALFERA